MDVIDSGFVLRERRFWESVDFGALLYRRWLGPIMVIFGLPLLVLTATLWFIIPAESMAWASFILWYLKPFWERCVLAPVGILFFSPHAKPRQLFKAVARIFSWRFLLQELTFGRFSFFRAYLTPVDMFERPPKKQRRMRRSWLLHNFFGTLLAWNTTTHFLELALFIVFLFTYRTLGLPALFAPAAEQNLFPPASDAFLIYAITLLISMPLYTLGNFAFYINQRTRFEAWDLRIAFQRLQKLSRGLKCLFILLLATALCGSPTLHAQNPSPAELAEDSQVPERLEMVLDGSDFGGQVKRYVLVPRQTDTQDSPNQAPNWFTGGGTIAAEILRVLIFVLAGALVVTLVLLVIRQIRRPEKLQKIKKAASPVVIFDPQLAGQRPDLDLACAAQAWHNGDQRLALASLYNASIAFIRTRYHIFLPECATEGQCQRIVQNKLSGTTFATIFNAVTRAWIQVSWSKLHMSDQEFWHLHQALSHEESQG